MVLHHAAPTTQRHEGYTVNVSHDAAFRTNDTLTCYDGAILTSAGVPYGRVIWPVWDAVAAGQPVFDHIETPQD
jgi:hypothetical protein